ncbi:MAG: HlyD family efflux transporter periplasmic adaptor subunit [Saprospiraceae bacterium]
MEKEERIDKKVSPARSNDFLVKPPGWILHHGISLVAFFIIILVILSSIIKYPDKVIAEAIITSAQPPLRLNAPKDGKLVHIQAQLADTVTSGSLLAIFEHEGSWSQINQLDSLLNDKKTTDLILNQSIPTFQDLGSLSSTYANFKKAVNDFRHEVEKDFTSLKILNLKNQIENLQSINKGLKRQAEWRKKTLSITQTQVSRDSNLFIEGSVSAIDYENSKKEMFNLMESMENLSASILQNNLTITQLEGQILESSQWKSDQIKELEGKLEVRLKELKGELEAWKNQHLITAPYMGIVEISNSIKPYQYFEKGQPILTLLPVDDSKESKGLATIPFKQSGKVGKDAIHLKLDGYLYKEFGYIKTHISDIAAVSNEGGYQASFNLPAPLITTYGMEIPFKQEMRGTAEIITKKKQSLKGCLNKLSVW